MIPYAFNPMGRSGGELPPQYRKAEYLEQSGGQYIDTELIFKDSRQGRLVCELYLPAAGNATPIGVRRDNAGFWISSGDAVKRISSKSCLVRGFAMGAWHTFIVERNRIAVGASEGDTSAFLLDCTESFVLFGWKDAGVVSRTTAGCAVKSLVYEENGSAVAKMLPCVRKSDGKPGMYDTVRKRFFVNQGTGEFLYN